MIKVGTFPPRVATRGSIIGFYQQKGFTESIIKIPRMHLSTAQVSKFPSLPIPSMIDFISSTANPPHLSTSYRISLPISKLCSLSLSSSPAPISFINSTKEHAFTVFYLINSCGLSPEEAISASRLVNFILPEKPDIVISFFNKHGFTTPHISKIVKRYPRILLCNPERTLLPKFEFLCQKGLSSSELVRVVTAEPHILKRSLDNLIIPTFEVLRDLLRSDDEVINMVKEFPSLLTQDPEVHNIQILREAGVPDSSIVLFLTYRRRGYKPTADDFRKIVEEVKKLGFDTSSVRFMWAIRVLRSMRKSTWEKKVDLCKRWGWSEDEIFVAFEKCPKFMVQSEDKITGVMDFLVNSMGLESSAIANVPGVITLSLERRIIPRCLLYQVIMKKGLFKKKRKLSLLSFVRLSENQFLDSILKTGGEEATELLKLYQETLEQYKVI